MRILKWLVFLVIFSFILILSLIYQFAQLADNVFPGSTPERPSKAFSPDYSSWYSYNNALFSVDFPLLPQQFSQVFTDPISGEKRDYEIVSAERIEGTLFIVTLIKPLRKSLYSDSALIDGLISDMVKNSPDNNLSSREESQFLGHSSTTFAIQSPEQHSITRAVVLSPYLIALSVLGEAENVHREEFDHFVGSFRWKALEKNEEPAPAAPPSVTFLDLDTNSGKLQGQSVAIRGFLYSREGQWILASEPNLRSCCVDTPHLHHGRVAVEFLIPPEWSPSAASAYQLVGRLERGTGDRWRLVEAKLEETNRLNEGTTYLLAGFGIAGTLFFGYSLLWGRRIC
ncbi:MAG: hypothetical protein KDK40_03400 [Chlamydiia bacterium]|nr:hypothetical protein [Chlamydiia bacterium]